MSRKPCLVLFLQGPHNRSAYKICNIERVQGFNEFELVASQLWFPWLEREQGAGMATLSIPSALRFFSSLIPQMYVG